MKVSELADRAGTSAKTIRFYEAEGILPSPPRSENGYRDYGETDVCRTRVVVSLRNLGLELPEAGRLAGMCAEGHCDDMSELLAARIPERRRAVAAAMEELTHLDAELASLERSLGSDQTGANCCLGKEVC
ncbi:MAG TPA: MerR family DNA-binding transcriptional regulator [Candidatus Limnocylindria bacterium]|nr:MerR family DNA-binding transcriptional regulator [Candidatus Limnocylindria bacterium]